MNENEEATYLEQALDQHVMDVEDNELEEMTQEVRERVWKDLWKAAERVKEVLIADNGGVETVDPEDEFLGNMIAEMHRILSWDPDNGK